MVQTRNRTILQAESSSDTEMETSPRVLTLPAPTINIEEAGNNNIIAIRPQHSTLPTLLPISLPETTFETLSTQLPSSIKIEELDFTYTAPSTTAFDTELAHLHKQLGAQDKQFYKLA